MTNLTAQGAPELPPLPKPVYSIPQGGDGSIDGFDPGQMRAFATDAVLADRQARQAAPEAPRVPEGYWLSPMEPDVPMKRAGLAERHDDLAASVWRSMRDSWLARYPAALAASEAEAVKVESELLKALIDLRQQVNDFCVQYGEADFYTGDATKAIQRAMSTPSAMPLPSAPATPGESA